MRKAFGVAVASVLIGLSGAVLSAPAQAFTAASNPCSGDGSSATNVIVPSGTTCNLQGSTISGNVFVQPGGRLIMGSGTHVLGNVYSSNAGTDPGTSDPLGRGTGNTFPFSVMICNSTVDGSVTINGSQSLVLVGSDAGCGGNTIKKSLTFDRNAGGVEAFGNTIGGSGNGSLNATNNTGQTHDNGGAVEIRDNTINNILNCSGNASVAATNNTAAQKTGQCAGVMAST